MLRTQLGTLALACVISLLAAGDAAPHDRIVVLTRAEHATLGTGALPGVTGDARLDQLCRELGIVAIEPYYPGTLRRPGLAELAERLRVLRLAPGIDASRVAAALADDPRIESAEIPVPARLFYQPNDPLYAQQWFLPHVGAPEAWDIVREPATAETIIGVIDTGIDRNDPDLAPSLWVNELEDLNGNGMLDAADLDGVDQDGNGFVDDVVGWDFAGGDPDPQESHAHGSAVSACVSAATDNAIGVAALGFGVRLMTLRAIGDGGALVDGYIPMLYAADNGARVVNCSWGIPVFRAFEQAIVDAVWAEDVVIVAAGGEGEGVVYPSAYNHVFAVSATDANDHRAPFGPYGDSIDICAPGVNIVTIWDGVPVVVSGTSFASGMVAGLAGLVRAADPTRVAADVVSIIESTALDLDALNPAYAGQLGAGRIDAHAAVAASIPTGAPTAAAAPRGFRLRCEPNPFADETVVRFDLDRASTVDLEVFDVRGRRVASLAQGPREAGSHAVAWVAGAAPSGVYFVRLVREGAGEVRRISLVR